MRAYALIGRTAADFATLEFHLQFLTSFLITGKHLSPEAVILTRRHMFADKIQLIREFMPFRFPNGHPLRERVRQLISDLTKLREQRNFFVHGYWLVNWQIIATERLIRCSDPKWRFDKTKEQWESMESHDIKLTDFETLIRQIGKITHEVHSILSLLENEQMNGAKTENSVTE